MTIYNDFFGLATLDPTPFETNPFDPNNAALRSDADSPRRWSR